MGRIMLLDCTLRDGGYTNDWRFGRDNLISISERLVDSGVDIIEVGFLDERRPFDRDRSIMPSTAAADRIFGGIDKGGAMLVGMIDYGTCGIERLSPCRDSCLDGIRVIFKKHLMREAMEFCREVKALGYKVFSQLVSITAYDDKDLAALAELVNDVRPYAASMVDTYGLLHRDELLHYYEILDRAVLPEIAIGFHAHNNFQMAYANSLDFIGRATERRIIVDGTLYGMGKSAGNAPLELLAMRLNQKYSAGYRTEPMLEAIEESILRFYEKTPWGYKPFFYMCGKHRCHPNYLTYFEGKKNLSVSKLDELLSEIEPEDKKLLYDKAVAEKLYSDYIARECDDAGDRERFAAAAGRKPLLILGPGKNIKLQRDKVERFINENSPYVISINYLPEGYPVDCVFLTNAKRYHDMTIPLSEGRGAGVKFLATTNVERRGGRFDFVINRAPLLDSSESISDNSFLMLIRFLISIGIKGIYCAGFDGYSDREDNYCNPAMEYSFVKQQAFRLNRQMKNAVAEFRERMAIEFITYSAYDEEEDINGASI